MNEHMKIGDCMKKTVVSISVSASIREAASLLVKEKVGTLPVLDNDRKLVGELSITDIIQIFLPDFVSLMEKIDFVGDYGVLKVPSDEVFQRADTVTLAEIMKEPTAVEEDSSLIKALSLMIKHDLIDLPIVRDGRLVGIASRVDIGRAFLIQWLANNDEGHQFNQ